MTSSGKPSFARPERVALALLAFALALCAPWEPPLCADEHRVRGASPLRMLAAGNFRGAIYNGLEFTQGRPGLALAYLPASVASLALADPARARDPSWEHDVWLDATDWRCARVMTALWALLAVLAVGALAERIGGRSSAALGAGWLALSVTFLHQARTLFPCIPVLALGALFLSSYLRAVEGGAESENSGGVRAGLWLLAALTVYPGVYPLAAVIPADLLLNKLAARRRAGVSVCTLLLGLLSVELLYRVAMGGSYLSELRQLSTTILMGNTEEGWSFAAEYFWVNDRFVGVLTLLVSLTAVGWAWRRRGPRAPALRLAALSFLLLYVHQALVLSTLLGRQVLYGRLVILWLALIVPLAAAAVPRLGRRRLALTLTLLLVHQLPGYSRLFNTPRAAHPAITYEGMNTTRREAWRREHP